MSAIEFSTRNKKVRVRGTERAHLSILLGELMQSILCPHLNRDLLLQVIPDGHYTKKSSDEQITPVWENSFRSAISAGDMRMIVDGHSIDSFDLTLNTALAVGNDALKLAASVHGQCEVNAFVRGKNRAWLADIIAKDKADIFRSGRGWEEVVEFLRESDEETVFMSYSVTDGIISRVHSQWKDDTAEERGLDLDDYDVDETLEEEWASLGEDKYWELAEEWADWASEYGLELSPERWADEDFSFGDGWNAGKLIKVLEEKEALKEAAYERGKALA